MASMLRAVSRNVSPLDTLDPLDEKSSTSADSRLAASSKLARVRVEDSKNRLTTTRPRSAGTFFTLRVETCSNPTAVRSRWRRSAGDRSSIPSR